MTPRLAVAVNLAQLVALASHSKLSLQREKVGNWAEPWSYSEGPGTVNPPSPLRNAARIIKVTQSRKIEILIMVFKLWAHVDSIHFKDVIFFPKHPPPKQKFSLTSWSLSLLWVKGLWHPYLPGKKIRFVFLTSPLRKCRLYSKQRVERITFENGI